jgi:hypothetical protein
VVAFPLLCDQKRQALSADGSGASSSVLGAALAETAGKHRKGAASKAGLSPPTGAALLGSLVSFAWSRPAASAALLRVIRSACKKDEGGDLAAAAWPAIRALLQVQAGRAANEVLGEAALDCMDAVCASHEAALPESVDAVCGLLRGTHEDSSALRALLMKWLASPRGGEWLSRHPAEAHEQLFKTILAACVHGSASSEGAAVLPRLSVSYAAVLDQMTFYHQQFAQSLSDSDLMDLVEEAASDNVESYHHKSSSAAGCFRAFHAALEGVWPLVRSMLDSPEEGGQQERSMVGTDDAQSLRRLLSLLFDSLRQCLDARLAAVMAIEYCKGNILDMASGIIARLGAASCLSSAAKEGGKASKKSGTPSAARGGAQGYAESRVIGDVDLILSVLQTSSLHHTQTSALSALSALMAVSPRLVSGHAISVLGRILSSTALRTEKSSREASGSAAISLFADGTSHLLRRVMRTLTEVSKTAAGGSASGQTAAWSAPVDIVVKSLFAHIQDIPHRRRIALVRTVIDLLGEECVVSCVRHLLGHVLAAHAAFDHGEPAESQQAEAATTVLLSIAAGRKASRMNSVAPHQEIFQLAVDSLLSCRSPAVQTVSLCNIARVAFVHFTAAAGAPASEESVGSSSSSSSAAGAVAAGVEAAQAGEFAEFVRSSAAERGTSLSVGAVHFSLAALGLQFAFSVLESDRFHRALAPFVTGWGDEDNDSQQQQQQQTPQELFISLCETVLEFIGACATAQRRLRRSRDESSSITESQSHAVLSSSKVSLFVGQYNETSFALSLARQSWQFCIDIVDCIQRLLDGPTFLAVLQELLHHDHPQVRQKALHVLAKRLQTLTETGVDVVVIIIHMSFFFFFFI